MPRWLKEVEEDGPTGSVAARSPFDLAAMLNEHIARPEQFIGRIHKIGVVV